MRKRTAEEADPAGPGASGSPFRAEDVRDYKRKRYRGWDQRFVHLREVSILKRFLEKMGKGSEVVLDIPCGYGRFSRLIAEWGGIAVNCDLSFHMVKEAESGESTPESLSRLGVVADAKAGLPFHADAFALVFSMRFFHHLHEARERQAVLGEFARVARDHILLSYYRTNAIHRLQRRLRRWLKPGRTHIKMISRSQILGEMEAAGLEVVREADVLKGLHAQRIALLQKVKT